MSVKKTNSKATETQTTESESKAAVAEAAEQTAEAVAESRTGQQETDKGSEVAAVADNTPKVYCGPSVRGVVRQYTVFTGEIPEMVADFIKEHPAASALIVPTERFAEVRKSLETRGTAEAILYKQIKSEL